MSASEPLLSGTAGERADADGWLFASYELPTSRADVTPFASGRTLDVDSKTWEAFAEQTRGPQRRSVLGLPVLSPNTTLIQAWDIVLTFVDLSYTAFIVAISLAFDNIAGGQFTWMTIADLVGTGFYVVDILVGFHVGFVVRHDVRRLLVTDGRLVARYYVQHGQFLVNFIACLPVVPEIYTSAQPTGVSSAFKILYGLRLLRLLRVMRLIKMVWGSAELLHNPLSRAVQSWVNTATLYIACLVFGLAVLVNLLGCIWWFVAEIEGLESSWAAYTALPYDLAAASTLAQYMASVFFVLTTMTTNGYGDIHPVTVVEQMVACVFMLLSVFYFGFVVNVVGDLLHYASRSTRAGYVLRSKLEDLDMWMAERFLPGHLKDKVRRYYVEVWSQVTGAGMPEAEYFEELPVALRGEIVLALAEGALAQSYMFRQLSHEAKAQLAAGAVPVRLVSGHNLYSEGDDADSFYMLQEGVAVAIHGMHRCATYRSPALLGQAAVFAYTIPDCQQRLHTVRAVTNCTLWRFSVRQISKLARHQPRVLATLCASYLQYIDNLVAAWEGRGRRPPARLGRIRGQVEELYDKARAQVPAWETETEDEEGALLGEGTAPHGPLATAPSWQRPSAWSQQPRGRERPERPKLAAAASQGGRSGGLPHSSSVGGFSAGGFSLLPSSEDEEDVIEGDQLVEADVLPGEKQDDEGEDEEEAGRPAENGAREVGTNGQQPEQQEEGEVREERGEVRLNLGVRFE